MLGEVAAIAVAQFWQRHSRVAVQGGQVGEQDAQALGVGGEHIQVDMNACAVGSQRELDVEHLAALDVQLPMRQLRSQSFEPGRIGPEVVHSQAVPRTARQHALASIGIEAGAQHVVARQQRRHRGLQSARIHVPTVEFVVEVGRHPAEALAGLPTDPVGVLHGRQVERFADGRLVVRRGHYTRAGIRPERATRFRCVGGLGSRIALARRTLGDQLHPGREPRPLEQVDEAHPRSGTPPPPGQSHGADRVEATLQQILLGIECCRWYIENRCDGGDYIGGR